MKIFENKFKGILTTLIFVRKYGLFVLGVCLSIGLVRNIYRMTKAQDRLDRAEAGLIQIKEENKNLKSELSYVESGAYIEKLARDQLGLAREGEIVLVLPDDEILRRLSPRQEKENNFLPDPNWKKWIKSFI